MKANHTPGPWKLCGHNLIANDFGVICQTARNDSPFKLAAPCASLEDEANRRLIAAAPDLLAALQALEAATALYFRDFQHLHPSIDSPLAQACAAIKKAEF